MVSPYYRLEQQAGLFPPPSNEQAAQVQLVAPAGVVADRNGDVYVADHYSLRRIGRDGRSTVVAGTSTFQCQGEAGHLYQYGPGAGGRGGCWARNLAVTAAGEIVIAHSGYYQVWAFDGRANKVIAGVNTGNSWGGSGGDGGQATRAYLNSPSGVAADSQGNIYIADSGNHVVRRIAPNGIISRYAGNGAAGGVTTDGSQALATALNYPMAVAVDSSGNVYVANTFGDTVLRVNPSGQVHRFAGGGASSPNDGDEGPATAAVLRRPVSISVNAAGDVFIAEGNRIRRVRNGIITTFAGSRTAGDSGDGAPANRASLNYPNGVFADSSGNVFIADTGNSLVRRVDSAGVITTVAGTREAADGKLLSETLLKTIGGMAVHPDGTLYFSNADNSRIQRLSRDGRVFVHAGSGFGFAGDSGPASRARFNGPLGIAFDMRGNLFVADSLNHRIRRIDSAGIVTTVAGTGEAGFSGDGGQAVRAQLNRPTSVAVDKSGALYIADAANFRIRRVAADGVITTIAGTGVSGFSGDWGKATEARLYAPSKVVVSDTGMVYFSDAAVLRVRKIRPDGIITPFAGGGGVTGINGWGEFDSTDAQSAGLHGLKGMAIDPAGNVFLAAGYVDGKVFAVEQGGEIVDIAGANYQGEPFHEWDRRALDDGLVVARGAPLPVFSEIAVDKSSGS
ncbi:MAG: NHL repeat-containing protein, partial [Bryobacter sp.]|nr:NHL repeat-containing protein [Bryobacter sp.]